MKHWFHHLFNPHCEECSRCKSCEILERELEIERARFNLLLDKLNGTSRSVNEVIENDETELKPISTLRKRVPFAVRQQMIEQNDMKTLHTLQDRWKEIHETVETAESNEELEKEILNTSIPN